MSHIWSVTSLNFYYRGRSTITKLVTTSSGFCGQFNATIIILLCSEKVHWDLKSGSPGLSTLYNTYYYSSITETHRIRISLNLRLWNLSFSGFMLFIIFLKQGCHKLCISSTRDVNRKPEIWFSVLKPKISSISLATRFFN